MFRIVTNCGPAEAYIGRCIASIREQSVVDFTAHVTVAVTRSGDELLAHIQIHDLAHFDFADRLAERGAIPSLERMLRAAAADYLAAPDRFIRDRRRAARVRPRKPAKPAVV